MPTRRQTRLQQQRDAKAQDAATVAAGTEAEAPAPAPAPAQAALRRTTRKRNSVSSMASETSEPAPKRTRRQTRAAAPKAAAAEPQRPASGGRAAKTRRGAAAKNAGDDAASKTAAAKTVKQSADDAKVPTTTAEDPDASAAEKGAKTTPAPPKPSLWPCKARNKRLHEEIDGGAAVWLASLEKALDDPQDLTAARCKELETTAPTSLFTDDDAEGSPTQHASELISRAGHWLTKATQRLAKGEAGGGPDAADVRFASASICRGLGLHYGAAASRLGVEGVLAPGKEATEAVLHKIAELGAAANPATLQKELHELTTSLRYGKRGCAAHTLLQGLLSARGALLPVGETKPFSLENLMYATGFFEGLSGQSFEGGSASTSASLPSPARNTKVEDSGKESSSGRSSSINEANGNETIKAAPSAEASAATKNTPGKAAPQSDESDGAQKGNGNTDATTKGNGNTAPEPAESSNTLAEIPKPDSSAEVSSLEDDEDEDDDDDGDNDDDDDEDEDDEEENEDDGDKDDSRAHDKAHRRASTGKAKKSKKDKKDKKKKKKKKKKEKKEKKEKKAKHEKTSRKRKRDSPDVDDTQSADDTHAPRKHHHAEVREKPPVSNGTTNGAVQLPSEKPSIEASPSMQAMPSVRAAVPMERVPSEDYTKRWPQPPQERAKNIMRRLERYDLRGEKATTFLNCFPKAVCGIFPVDATGATVRDPVVPTLRVDPGWRLHSLAWWGVQERKPVKDEIEGDDDDDLL